MSFRQTLITEYNNINTHKRVDMQLISNYLRRFDAQVLENNAYYVVIEFNYPVERSTFANYMLGTDYTFFLDGDHYIQINK